MRNKIFKIISFLAVALFVSSCLKDNVGEDWTSTLKGKMYAEVWNAGFKATGLQPTPDDVVFKFLVNIASDQPPTQDITVTLAVNADAITKYNAIKGTNYQLYPYIEILTPTVTIAAGTRNAYARVKVWNANTLSACDNFMAPISITEATGGVVVADPINQGSRLMALPIANKYQGEYHAYGYFVHPTLPRFIDMDRTFSTLTCKSIHGDMADVGPDYTIDLIVDEDPAHAIVVDGNTVNPVTVLGYGAQVFEQLNVDKDLITNETGVTFNYWDPAAKAFVLRYRYNNGAAWREIMETLTKI
jgi:hypothetical protein